MIGSHHSLNDSEARARLTRRGRTVAGALTALTAAGAVLAGAALAAPAVPPPSDPEDSPVANEAHGEPAAPGTPDAEAVFTELQKGDKVSVVKGSVEWEHRHPGKKP